MILLIPGPVTTRPEVRAAMACDFAPWDDDFRPLSRRVRNRVRAIAGGEEGVHAALPLQGCGHFGTEAALRSMLPPGGRILVPDTGSYAERMIRLANEAGRIAVPLAVDRDQPVSPALVSAALRADPRLSHVGLVYSETSTGLIHDPVAIGAVTRAAGRRMILDAVSAFGALPLNVSAQPEIDAVVFTTNKCLEGLPGLSFVVVRTGCLQPVGQAGSWSFDLADVHAQAQRDDGGSFRFTPPAQILAAFDTALDFFDAEGGQPARLERYHANARTVYAGMQEIGLLPCIAAIDQGPIVMNIHAPDDPAWSLQGFVDALKSRGFLISNFFNTPTPSFRVGCIGAVTPDDMRRFVQAADAALTEIGVRRPTASYRSLPATVHQMS